MCVYEKYFYFINLVSNLLIYYQVIAERLAKEPDYKQRNPDYAFEELIWASDYQINQLTRIYKSITGYGLPQELIPQAGKMEELDKLLPQLKQNGHRTLIFSQFTMVLDILEEYLTIRGHTFVRFVINNLL